MDLMQWLPNFSNFLPTSLLQSRQSQQVRQVQLQFLAGCQDNDLQLVRSFLQLGMNPDIRYSRGATPLHVACDHGLLEMLRLLMQYGADADPADADGVTPLMRAAANGSARLVKELLKSGADAQADCHRGWSVLTYALSSGSRAKARQNSKASTELVQALLARGAADAACDSLSEAWTSADAPDVSTGGSVVAQLVADALMVDEEVVSKGGAGYRLASDHVIRRAVIDKAAEGKADLLEAASKQGVSLDFVIDCDRPLPLPVDIPQSLRGSKDDAFCVSPVVAAVLFGRESVLQLLSSIGVSLDQRDRLGFTPVFVAAATGHTEALDFLLAHRCSPSAKNHAGLTAAHLCAIHCPEESAQRVLQLLMKRGAPVDKADQSGRTPAHHLMDRGLDGPLRFLAGHRGCNPHRVLAPHGVSLFGYAVKRGWEAEVRHQLVAHHQRRRNAGGGRRRQASLSSSESLESAAAQAVAAGQRSVLEDLFVFGVVDSAPSAELVRLAAQLVDVKMMRLLTDRLGADVDALGADGETALTWAAAAGLAEVAKLLLERGANPGQRNAAGRSAFELAAKFVDDQRVFERLSDLFDEASPPLWPVAVSAVSAAGTSSSSSSSSSQRTESTQAEPASQDADSAASSPAPSSTSLDIKERPKLTVKIFGRSVAYRVVDYCVTFAEPVDLFRKARRGDLNNCLSDVITDVRHRLPLGSLATVRASTATVRSSVDWPNTEYAVGLTEVKLRQLLCQLHHVTAQQQSDSNRRLYPTGPLLTGQICLCVTAKV